MCMIKCHYSGADLWANQIRVQTMHKNASHMNPLYWDRTGELSSKWKYKNELKTTKEIYFIHCFTPPIAIAFASAGWLQSVYAIYSRLNHTLYQLPLFHCMSFLSSVFVFSPFFSFIESVSSVHQLSLTQKMWKVLR